VFAVCVERTQDDFCTEVLGFLDAAEDNGKEILTVISQQGQEVRAHAAARCFCMCGVVCAAARPACVCSTARAVLCVCVRAAQVDPGQHNVAYEARLFKRMFLKLREE
jgi:hypothetical protein